MPENEWMKNKPLFRIVSRLNILSAITAKAWHAAIRTSSFSLSKRKTIARSASCSAKIFRFCAKIKSERFPISLHHSMLNVNSIECLWDNHLKSVCSLNLCPVFFFSTYVLVPCLILKITGFFVFWKNNFFIN